MKIGLFGGTFDPIHVGHLFLAETVRDGLDLDRVIFIPSARPPHKDVQAVAPAHLRLKMVELAIKDHSSFEVSKIEVERSSPSYSIDTVREFGRKFQKDTLYFIVGSDSLFEMHGWYKVDELVNLCQFIYVTRPGFVIDGKMAQDLKLEPEVFRTLTQNFFEMIPFGVSSTEIRHKVAEGRSIRYLVPEKVRRFIERKRLYK